MKKTITSLFFLSLFIINQCIVFGQVPYQDPSIVSNPNNDTVSTIPSKWVSEIPTTTPTIVQPGSTSATQAIIDANNTTSPVNGITINEKCLLNGQCKYDIYDTLGIRQSVRATGEATSVGLFVQDIILSATFFIGTVVTIALIVSGLMYIFAGATGKDPATAKKGITWSLIGLLIVSSSYLIIRLIQYIAKGM